MIYEAGLKPVVGYNIHKSSKIILPRCLISDSMAYRCIWPLKIYCLSRRSGWGLRVREECAILSHSSSHPRGHALKE